MKKNRIFFVAIVSALIISVLFCGCSSGYGGYDKAYDGASMSASSPSYYPENNAARDEGYDYEAEELGFEKPQEGVISDLGGGKSTETIASETSSRKIIMTAHYTIETKDYDDSYSKLLALADEMGGYVSESDYRGVSLNSYGDSSRQCSVTVRVPADRYREFNDALASVGNISYSSESQSDVTMQYFDLQARIESLEVQEDRLLELLSEAENVSEILEIEDRLSYVRYQIESYTTNFKALADEVAYSTVSVSLNEVIEYTKEPIKELTFGEKIVRRLGDGWGAFIDFWEGALLVILVCLPFLIVIAVIVIVIVLLAKRAKKRRINRQIEIQKMLEEQQARVWTEAQAKVDAQKAQDQNAAENAGSGNDAQ